MGNVFQYNWEVNLIIILQELIYQFPFLEYVFEFFTFFGEPIFGALIVAILYFSNRKEWGRYLMLSILSCQLMTDIIKNIVFRIRPYIVNEEIECLKVIEAGEDIYDSIKQGFSFPSGHVTFISSLAASVSFRTRKVKYLIRFLPLILMVAISRFSLGVHYPTDVAAGAFVGMAGVCVFDFLYGRMKKEKLYLLIAAFCILGMTFCISEDYYSITGLMIGFMCGDLNEERNICFEETDDLFEVLIRLVGAALVFLGLSQFLKLFADAFEYGSKAYLVYRSFRYAVSAFAAFGIYPYCFTFISEFRKKQH